MSDKLLNQTLRHYQLRFGDARRPSSHRCVRTNGSQYSRRPPVAGILHALFLLAFMLLAAPLAGLLALPALVLTAWIMAEPQHFIERMRACRSDQLLLVMTLVLTVLADLTVAIGAGVAVSLMLRLTHRGAPESDWQAPDR